MLPSYVDEEAPTGLFIREAISACMLYNVVQETKPTGLEEYVCEATGGPELRDHGNLQPGTSVVPVYYFLPWERRRPEDIPSRTSENRTTAVKNASICTKSNQMFWDTRVNNTKVSNLNNVNIFLISEFSQS